MSEPEAGLLVTFATRLAGLAREMSDSGSAALSASSGTDDAEAGSDPARTARLLLDQLHMRKQFLSPSLFHEPAWEILLSVFVSHHRGHTLNVKRLVGLIDAPPTTSQRWIDQLVHMKLLHREVDPLDRRRLEISMSPTGAKSVGDYLAWWTTHRISPVDP